MLLKPQGRVVSPVLFSGIINDASCTKREEWEISQSGGTEIGEDMSKRENYRQGDNGTTH